MTRFIVMPADYIIVIPPARGESSVLYLATTSKDQVYWTYDIKSVRRFVTFGAAKLFAEARLPIDRVYKIVTIPSKSGA